MDLVDKAGDTPGRGPRPTGPAQTPLRFEEREGVGLATEQE